MAADDQTINAFKMPRVTLARLDAWLEKLNRGRRGPRLSRTDLMRGVLDWASEHEPDWEARGATPSPQPPIEGAVVAVAVDDKTGALVPDKAPPAAPRDVGDDRVDYDPGYGPKSDEKPPPAPAPQPKPRKRAAGGAL